MRLGNINGTTPGSASARDPQCVRPAVAIRMGTFMKMQAAQKEEADVAQRLEIDMPGVTWRVPSERMKVGGSIVCRAAV